MHTTCTHRSNPSDAAFGWSDESIVYTAAGVVAGSLLLGLGVLFIARSRRPLSAPAGTPPPWPVRTSDAGQGMPPDGTPLPPSPRLSYEPGQDIILPRQIVLYEGEDDERGTAHPAQAALTVVPSAHRPGRWFVHLNNGPSGWVDLTG
jgi:hypothetical protein